MTDIKISQLNSTTELGAADLLAVSKSMGGSNWESKSITGLNLLHSLTAARTISVAKDGARDASTIKDGIAMAVALTPTAMNPVVIRVFPGSYSEDNPITIPQWVSIYSEGGQYGANVVASNDGAIFIGTGNSTLNGFTIAGLTAFSNIAYKSATTTTGKIENCIITNCYTGILSDNGSITADYITGLSGLPLFPKLFNEFISCINGGFLVATNCNLTGILTRPVYGYYSYGTGSQLYLFSCAANNCVNGMYADNGGYIDGLSSHFDDCDHTIHIGATGSSHIKVEGCIIKGSTVNDLFIESATARVSYIGHIDSSKFSIVSGATVNIIADDESTSGGLITGKASLQGKISIGTPGAINLGEDLQVNIGEGSSFVNDKQGNEIVEYWSYDASAASGSRFTRFANNAGTQLAAANDAIIVGCKYPFPAIRLDVDIALVTANYLTTEYWNGSTWVDLAGITAGGGVAGYKRSDFTKRGLSIFRNVETQFVECSSKLFSNGDWADDNDILDEIPAWDANEDFYAIRFRNNGALTSGMTFKNGMVKPHSFMVSTSGQKANFGLYRTDKLLYIDSKLFYPDRTNPPSYVDLQMSTNIMYADNPVCLRANAVSKVSASFIIPFDIDTSSPLQVWIDGVVTATDPGKDIYSTVYIARIDPLNPGVVGSLPEIEVDQITTVTGNANSFVSVVQEIDASSYRSEDLLLVAFARNAGDPSDTYTGNFILGDFTFKYKSKFV